MPKELKPGWVYVNNDNPIGLEYAIHKETGWVYFEDGVKYSPEEIKILIESGGPASKELHTVKKIFQGEIDAMTEREQMIKVNQMKADMFKIHLAIQIPVLKYRKLQEIARLSGQESLTFIDGTADFQNLKCSYCPAHESCNGKKRTMQFCYGNFLTWFFKAD
jgi:hypothetical protein